MSTLTENQKKAHDHHRHLSVIANAGSGKTTVLVERYVDIIQYGYAGAHEIVALTFTEKAAGELRQRIAETIQRRYGEVEDRQERARLELLREQLSSAMIGTIHSFCARLLREYPVDVPTAEWGGIDASFTILEGVDQRSLIGEAVNEVFQSILGGSETPSKFSYHQDLLNLVRMLGRNSVLSIVHHLLSKREIADTLVREYSRPDDEIVLEWNTVVENYVDTLISSSFLIDALRECNGHILQNKKEEFHNAFDVFCGATDRRARRNAWDVLWQLFLQKNHHPRSGIFTPENARESLERPLRTVRQTAAAVASLTEGFEGREGAHRLLVRSTRTFLAVVQEVLVAYDRRKAENAQLDFEDLQLHVKALLTRPEIRRKLSAMYSYIMVDEFQDTNRLQYDILLHLIDNFSRGNLFIVGDPKQSIYGFRNAEVKIFIRAINEIERLPQNSEPFSWHGKEIRSTPGERAGRVTLPESFRLLTAIAAFVNTVFARCMDFARNPFSVSYDELVVGREAAVPGKVELLLPVNRKENAEGTGDDGSAGDIEEEMIARRILTLHREEYPMIDRRTGESRPIRFGDIAILLRSRTNLHRLEQALLRFHVPYLISSGGGFFQTQELYDFFNYFQFLLNPHDDTALAGILRSPFFACSDLSLFRISRVEAGNDFWSKTCLWIADHPESDPDLTRAVTILRDDLRRAGRQSLPDSILEIIRRTGYDGVAAASRRAIQHTANVKKLLHLARSFEARGFSNHYDFVERLRILIEEEDQEGQASIDEAENTVHIMTIHAAKGLEFGAVIIPYLQKEFHYDSEPFIDSKGTIGYSIVQPMDFDKKLAVPLTEMLRQESRRKTEAEEQRIFYVACTRARDLLVLSGTLSRRLRTATPLTWIQDALEIGNPVERGRTVKNVVVKKLVLTDGEYSAVEDPFPLTIDWLCRPDELPVEMPLGEEKTFSTEFSRAEAGPIESGEEGESYSATQIKTYHDCPLKYHLLYHLGTPELRREPYRYHEDEEDEHDPLSGSVYGTLIHRVLQNILTNESLAHISEYSNEAVLEGGLGRRDDIRELAGKVEREIAAFCSSALGRRILSADEVKTEFRLEGKLGSDSITGTIDRLVRTGSTWEVVDYKTDSMRSGSVEIKIRMYRYQMLVYAWLVGRFMNQADVPVTLYFTDQPDASTTVVYTKAEIDLFEEEMRTMVGNMRSAGFSKNLEHCTECYFSRDRKCISG